MPTRSQSTPVPASFLPSILQESHDLPVIRKLLRLVLAVDPLTIHDHVKDATTTRNERCIRIKCRFEFRCYTSSVGLVVSLGTVFDRNLHKDRLSVRRTLTCRHIMVNVFTTL